MAFWDTIKSVAKKALQTINPYVSPTKAKANYLASSPVPTTPVQPTIYNSPTKSSTPGYSVPAITAPTLITPSANKVGVMTNTPMVLNNNPVLNTSKPSVISSTPAPAVSVPESLPAKIITGSKPISTASNVIQTNNPDSFVSSIKPMVDASTAKLESLMSQYNATSDKLGTSGERLKQVQGELGIPEQTKQLQDLNMQIAQLTSAYDQGIVDVSGKIIPMQFITGQQAQMRSQKAAEIGGLAAVQQALQGNIALAQQTAEQTVNLEFAQEEQEMEKLKTQIDYEYQNLSRADKLKADEMNQQITERQNQIDQAKQDRTSILSIATQAAQNGAPADLVRQIVSSGNLEGALEYATPYLAETTTEKPIVQSYKDAQGNEVLMQYNSQTGGWDTITGGQTSISGMNDAAYAGMENVSLVDQILSDPNLSAITGIPNPLSFVPGSASQLVKNRFDQLKNTLSLEGRGALKGSGQISDFEAKMLEKAQSALGRNLSDADAVKVLGEIKEAFQRGALKAQGYTQAEIEEAKNQLGNIDAVYKGVFTKPLSVGNSTQTVAMNIPNGTKAGQCGRFVNKLTGLGVGDSYASKMAKMNPTIKRPAPGMVFVMPYKDTGHTGIILAINNGIATVKDSNYHLNEKVDTHQIPVSKMTGFTYA